ncbi:MAG: large-conductance mechanosensitive channel protein MscL [Pseudomonadota bacterium]
MGLLNEFREFAIKGNVIDMAVGIIIGGAFGTIVGSLIKDVIMPPIGHFFLNGVDFSKYSIPLAEAVGDKPAVAINIGAFLNNVISFVVLAFVVFLMVKFINALRRRFEEEQAAAPPTVSTTDALLTEIRDELRKQ